MLKRGGYQPLVRNNTVFTQMFKLVSRQEFQHLTAQYVHGIKAGKMSHRPQFIALEMARLKFALELSYEQQR